MQKENTLINPVPLNVKILIRKSNDGTPKITKTEQKLQKRYVMDHFGYAFILLPL